MYEHNALGYWSGLALCLTKVRSSRARCPATALISYFNWVITQIRSLIKVLTRAFKGLHVISPPSEPPGEIMSIGVSPVNYSDSAGPREVKNLGTVLRSSDYIFLLH